MATETVHYQDAAGKSLYVRVFGLTGAEQGLVFDFNDNTFKALGAATTPYKAMTEKADMAGTGQSGYLVDLDLSLINATLAINRYLIKVYENAAPAVGDNPVADPISMTVQLGEWGQEELTVQFETNVKSTSGVDSQIHIWLERFGRQVDIISLDAAATCQLEVREHGSGAALFTANGVAANVNDGIFEIEQNLPNFTDDRGYTCKASITISSVVYETIHNRTVIG